MELVYLYVEKFSNIITDKEINFSSRVNFSYNRNTKKLEIQSKKYIPDFFSNKIKNISAIVGKNGEGKTTLLDILGITYRGRENVENKYFMIYSKNNIEFYIEGTGIDLLSNIVEGIPSDISNTYSIIAELNDNILSYRSYMNRNRIDSKIKYINVRENYNSRHIVQANDKTSVFMERLYSESSYCIKYKILCDLLDNDKNKLNFINDNIKINLKYNDTDDFLMTEIIEELNELYDINLDIHINHIKINYSDKGDKDPSIIMYEKEIGIEYVLNENLYSVMKILHIYIMDMYYNILSNNKEDIDYLISVKNKINNKYEELFFDDIANESLSIQMIMDRLQDMVEYILEYFMKSLEKPGEQFLRLKEWLKCVIEINNEYITKNGFSISVTNQIDKDVYRLLYLLEEYIHKSRYNELNRLVDVHIQNLSEGQEQFLNLISKIFYSIYNIGEKDIEYVETIIILLDEPDRSFHPEWSRRFIPTLIDVIDEIGERIENIKFQVLLTTHSPFIASDLPKDNVVLVDRRINNHTNIGKTFGSNIHMLLSHQFFMESTIGEFAKSKIIECISFLDKYEKKKVHIEGDKLESKKREIEYIIEEIGEPVLKVKLENLYRKNFPRNKDDYTNKIKNLEEEKNRLEKILNDNGLCNIDGVMELLREKIEELKQQSGESI